MTRALHAIAALGGALLAVSFFVPPGDFHSPLAQFLQWTVRSDFSGDTASGIALSVGIAVAVVYPYAWALAAAAGAWWSARRRAALWAQLACHAVGGGAISFVGILLYTWGDDRRIPPEVQVVAIVLPLVLVALVVGAAYFVRPARRVPAASIIGFIPHVMLQPALALLVMRDHGPWWGYVLGTLGALLGLAGNVCVFLIEGVRAGYLHHRSDVQ